MLHTKRSALNHWWSSKNPFFKILKNVWVIANKHSKKSLFRYLAIFDQFFGYKSDIFLIFCKTDFCLIISDLRRFFWCITQLYLKKIIFDLCPLFVTFEVMALVGKQSFLKNSNEFRLFIYWSNFRTAEIGQTLILVKKAVLEQTLN